MRTILSFHEDHKQLLVSGMLAGGDELAGTPAIIDAKLGNGHVVLFAINPVWRQITQGSWALLHNTILHFDHLGVSAARRAARPAVGIGAGAKGYKERD